MRGGMEPVPSPPEETCRCIGCTSCTLKALAGPGERLQVRETMRFHWHGTLPKIITSENPKPMPDEDEDEIAMWAA